MGNARCAGRFGGCSEWCCAQRPPRGSRLRHAGAPRGGAVPLPAAAAPGHAAPPQGSAAPVTKSACRYFSGRTYRTVTAASRFWLLRLGCTHVFESDLLVIRYFFVSSTGRVFWSEPRSPCCSGWGKHPSSSIDPRKDCEVPLARCSVTPILPVPATEVWKEIMNFRFRIEGKRMERERLDAAKSTCKFRLSDKS